MFHLVSSGGVGARVQAAGDARERPPAPDAGERVRAGRERERWGVGDASGA